MFGDTTYFKMKNKIAGASKRKKSTKSWISRLSLGISRVNDNQGNK